MILLSHLQIHKMFFVVKQSLSDCNGYFQRCKRSLDNLFLELIDFCAPIRNLLTDNVMTVFVFLT